MSKKRRPSFSAVVNFMSQEAQERLSTPEITRLPLEEIRPDPGQPRQLLPPDLARALDAGELAPPEVLARWLARDVQGRALEELRTLADSIARHGLINPISVRTPTPDEPLPAEVPYLIVTGERRYWAHLLLAHEGRPIQEGESSQAPTSIKATVAAPGISVRAHQLIENLVREDINAVEKARGLWALRLELSGVHHGAPLPLHPAELEDAYELLPWAHVEEALGLSKRYRIYLTATLKLCEAAQALVMTHNLSERLIRPVVQALAGQPEAQVAALEQIVAWQQSENAPASLTRATRELAQELAQPASGPRTHRPRGQAQFERRVRGILNFLGQREAREWQALLRALPRDAALREELRRLRDQLNQLVPD